jgi:hypothetical protein
LVFGHCFIRKPLPNLYASIRKPPQYYHYTGGSVFPTTLSDGTSNTIIWTDVLGQCGSFPYAGNTYQVQRWWYFVGDPYGNYETLGDADVQYNGPTSYTPQPQAGVSAGQCQTGGVTIATNATSGHTAVIQAGLGDGSVRPISQGISGLAWILALVPNDGAAMPSDW